MTLSHVSAVGMTRVSSREAPSFLAAVVRSRQLQRSLLVLGDVLTLGVSFAAIAQILHVTEYLSLSHEEYWASAGFGLIWLLMLGLAGAYRLRHIRAGAIEYKRAINASVICGGTISIICYLVKYDYPRMLFGMWMLVGMLALCLARLARRRGMHQLHKRGVLFTPVVIAGDIRHVDEIAAVLGRESWVGYRVEGAISDDHREITDLGVPVLGRLANLPAIIERADARMIVFAEGSFESSAEFHRLAWQLEQSCVHMVLAPTLADVSAERLEFRPLAGLPLVDVGRPRALRSLRWLKRSVDIVGSALCLILASPVLVAAMIAIKSEDGGPVLFRQRRVGLDGKEFDCLKLRSMCVGAEERLTALQEENEGAGVLFKIKDDPRITRTGKFIRRYSIDELPQLWNTLVGDMSLVGPRPALPSEVEKYDSDTRRRLRVRAGITGLWQVSGRSSLSWEDTVRLDLYYVDNWSLVQDLIILLRTAKAVVGSSGAY